jgi:hypothetical protein
VTYHGKNPLNNENSQTMKDSNVKQVLLGEGTSGRESVPREGKGG